MSCTTPEQPSKKPAALSLSPEALRAVVADLGEPGFRGKQLVSWLFEKRTFSLDEMTDLPKGLRAKLADALQWDLPPVVDTLNSEDGTTKLLLSSDRGLIETVVMRYEGRTSLCVSSQVGCKLACSFCQTGKLGFVRNLTAAEIVAQFAIANQLVRPEGRKISHIVFMGMGEPLDNYEAVRDAVQRFTGEGGFGLSQRNVTVSTSGIASKIGMLAQDCRAALAVSLHAAREDLRTELMPINRRYPLAQLKEELIKYQQLTGNKITIEYILIKDKNCGIREAKDLVRFIHGLRAKVNLIPFNSHPGMPYQRPSADEIRTFQSYLSDRSIPAPVRYSKGLDVSAACGQLAAKHQGTLSKAPVRSDVLGV
jgi:23S rRNA (adenine2503-C2)-methyltransferase